MPRVTAALAAMIFTTLPGCTFSLANDIYDAPRIWDVRAQRYVSNATLTQRIIDARYRLLGEVHDNPAHHALRAEMLRAIARSGKRPAVVFEQFDAEHDRALIEAQSSGADAESLASAGALDRKSWEWPLHKPLLEAAIATHMPVRAGNISRAMLDPIARRGDVSSLDAGTRGVLAAAPWTESKQRILDEEIEAGHCGKLPASLVPRLALAQRARDAALAAAVLGDATADGTVLIAGNGHVRADLGVPLYLGSAGREAISVGWIELEPLEMQQRDAGRTAATEHPGFDYLWLTDPVSRDDPCASIPTIKDDRTKAS